MKIKLMCEIEADVADKEEVEALQDSLKKGNSLKTIKKLWSRVLEDTLMDICPEPVYENRKMNFKVDYFEEEKEIQVFQLGDIAYMLDEDYREFEGEVCKIELRGGHYIYETRDCDFQFKDIGEWVFQSEIERIAFC